MDKTFVTTEFLKAYNFLNPDPEKVFVSNEDGYVGIEYKPVMGLEIDVYVYDTGCSTGILNLEGEFSRPFLARHIVRNWYSFSRSVGADFLLISANENWRLWRIFGFKWLYPQHQGKWERYLDGIIFVDREDYYCPMYKLLENDSLRDSCKRG